MLKMPPLHQHLDMIQSQALSNEEVKARFKERWNSYKCQDEMASTQFEQHLPVKLAEAAAVTAEFRQAERDKETKRPNAQNQSKPSTKVTIKDGRMTSQLQNSTTQQKSLLHQHQQQPQQQQQMSKFTPSRPQASQNQAGVNQPMPSAYQMPPQQTPPSERSPIVAQQQQQQHQSGAFSDRFQPFMDPLNADDDLESLLELIKPDRREISSSHSLNSSSSSSLHPASTPASVDTSNLPGSSYSSPQQPTTPQNSFLTNSPPHGLQQQQGSQHQLFQQQQQTSQQQLLSQQQQSSQQQLLQQQQQTSQQQQLSQQQGSQQQLLSQQQSSQQQQQLHLQQQQSQFSGQSAMVNPTVRGLTPSVGAPVHTSTPYSALQHQQHRQLAAYQHMQHMHQQRMMWAAHQQNDPRILAGGGRPGPYPSPYRYLPQPSQTGLPGGANSERLLMYARPYGGVPPSAYNSPQTLPPSYQSYIRQQENIASFPLFGSNSEIGPAIPDILDNLL